MLGFIIGFIVGGLAAFLAIGILALSAKHPGGEFEPAHGPEEPVEREKERPEPE